MVTIKEEKIERDVVGSKVSVTVTKIVSFNGSHRLKDMATIVSKTVAVKTTPSTLETGTNYRLSTTYSGIVG